MTKLFSAKHQSFFIFMSLYVFSFALRIINADNINNAIHDLGARYVLACFDIIQGIYHFPQHPWILEHDEAAFSWIMVPWVWIWGRSWASFRLFGVALASLMPAFVYWITEKKIDRNTGIIAGFLLASAPAQLVWDRYLFMNLAAIPIVIWLISIYLSSIDSDSYKTYILIGFVLSAGTYFAHYPLALPVAALIIFINKKPFKVRMLRCSWMVISYLGFTLPLIIYMFNNPEYILWRQRHFHDEVFELTNVFTTFANANIHYLQSLFSGNYNCLFFRPQAPVLNTSLAVFLIAGLIFLGKKGLNVFLFTLGVPLIMYVMLGLIRTENWSSVYHKFAMPFLVIAAAVGCNGIINILHRLFNRKIAIMVSGLMLTSVITLNIWQFFWGPYHIHPRPDTLTRLQSDMKHLEKIPYLFSTGISEVTHYHMPFWVATRAYQDRISIIGLESDSWISDPDKVSVEIMSKPDSRVGIVVEVNEVDDFREKLGSHVILDEVELPESGLKLLICAITVPEKLQRTWTESYIPPVLPIKRN
jgi:hypothetical protein